MKSRISFLSLVLLCIFIISCDHEKQEFIPDTSHIISNANIIRFDSAVINMDTIHTLNSYREIKQAYPNLAELYFERVLALKGETEEETAQSIQAFLKNSQTRWLFDTVNLVFDDLNEINKEFKSAFKLLKHYVPQFQEPNLYAVVSEFGYQRFIFDDETTDGIGIGIDMFLGNEFPYKSLDPQNPSFSDYLTRSFNKDHLVKKSIELIFDELMPPPSGVRMIDQMIYNGKKLYLLDKILPFKSDTVVIEYTASQLDWVKENELEIWSFFVDEELLYETNQQKINKYLNPSPNSPGMPLIAPGRTANFIGWQIMKAFARKNPKASMLELLNELDAQKILEESRYRPKQ